MRGIKFRGLSKNIDGTKEWAYGYLTKCDGEFTIDDEDGFGCFVDAETIGQYTGCKDANGKEIYEGDIVEIVDGPTLHPDNCYIGTKFKVFYNQESCSFMMQDIYDEDNTQYFDLDLGGIPPKYLEVIGNIYENKELLEVE